MSLRTPISKVKGLGPAKEGVNHWIMQRLTAIALVPLVFWFIYTIIKASMSGVIFPVLTSPFSAIAMILFLSTAFYHGSLGMRVVIEDYIHCSVSKVVLIILVNFTSIILGVGSVLAVIKAHLGAA
ncbi:succinate dehydrogenase, hydrophobic membrane anchor protein [Rickettsiales bacterium]|nr:succinate dehydrogenase, hydrophobic membrane anchor protein [Rickettsiales bacterium]